MIFIFCSLRISHQGEAIIFHIVNCVHSSALKLVLDWTVWVQIAEQLNKEHSTASHAHSCITFCMNGRMNCIHHIEVWTNSIYFFSITNNNNIPNRIGHSTPTAESRNGKITQMLIVTDQFVGRRQIAVTIAAKTNNSETIHIPEYLLSIDFNEAYAVCNGRSTKSFVAVTPPKAWTQFIEPKKEMLFTEWNE